MITEIYKLGKFSIQNGIKVEDRTTGKIIFINIDPENLSDKKFTITVEDYIPENKDRYLYEEGESKGNNSAPFAPLTEPEKTIEKKIIVYIKELISESQNPQIKSLIKDFQIKSLENIKKTLIEYQKEIINKVEEEQKQIKQNKETKNDKIFISLKIKQNNEYKYLGDIPEIKELHYLLKEQKLKSNLNDSDSICSFCLEEKRVGPATNKVFKFYTVDKLGFIASSQIIKFDDSKSWQNYPVCIECHHILLQSKKLLQKNFSFSIENFRYYLIPCLIVDNPQAQEELMEIIQLTEKKQTLKDIDRITTDQEEILSLLSDKNFLYFYIMLYEESNSAERILLLIEDIPPTTFKKIFEAKKQTEELIKNLNYHKYNHKYNLSKLKKFFISKKATLTIDSEKFLLDFIEKLFKLQPINYNLLIKYFILNLQHYINIEPLTNFDTHVLDAISNILLFYNLGLIKINNYELNEGGDEMLENFFKQYNLDTLDKQGIFLLGALTRILLEEQKNKLNNNMPFLNKLKSLKMNKRDILELFPSVVNKLYEYEIENKAINILKQEISDKLLKSSFNLSNEELNFYFTCGLSLHNKIKEIYGGDKNE